MRSWTHFLFPAALFLGLVLLLVGSRSGIWDPWEMDRAHVARQMAGKPKILVVEPTDELLPRMRQLDSENLFFVGMDHPAPLTGSIGKKVVGGTSSRLLKMSETRLQAEVFHGIVVDAALLVPEDLEGPRVFDTDKGLAFLESFEDAAPGAPIWIVADDSKQCETVTGALEQSMVRQALNTLDQDYDLLPEALKSAPKLDVARREAQAGKKGKGAAKSAELPHETSVSPEVQKLVEERAGVYPFVLSVPCVTKDDDSLTAALAKAHGISWWRAQFKGYVEPTTKKNRTPDLATHTVPPLDYWMCAVSYKVFGFSEFSSRLPFVIMGFLTLLLFGLFLRSLLGAGIAGVATLVLATIPMFIGQSKNLSGEASYMFALTLGVLSFGALVLKGVSVTRILGLAVAFVLLFLAKGLFGLFILIAILGSYIVVTRDLRWRPVLLPFAVLTALFGVLILVVQLPSEWTFFEHFKFMNKAFRGGPLHEHRTFEYFVRGLAFSWMPWTLIMPFAFANLLPRKDLQSDESRLGLLTLLWFAIPFMAHSAMLPDFLHAVYPASASLALAVALLWRRERQTGTINRLQGVVIVGMAIMLMANLVKSPGPMFSFLTWDPHFSSETDPFPVDFVLGTLGKGLLALTVLLMAVYYLRGGTIFVTVARFFRRPRPLWIALWVLFAGLGMRLLVGLGTRYFDALKHANARHLGLVRELPRELLMMRPESIMAYIGAILIGLVALLKFSPMGGWLAKKLRFLSTPARAVAGLHKRLATSLLLPALGAVLALGAFILMAMGVNGFVQSGSLAEGWWGAAFFSSAMVWLGLALPLLVGAALVVPALLGLTKERLAVRDVALWLLVAVTVTLLAFAGKLFRTSTMTAPDVWVLMLASFVLVLDSVLVWSASSKCRFHTTSWLFALGAVVWFVVPLANRWPFVEGTVYPSSSANFLHYLFLESKTTWLLLLPILFLIANALFEPFDRWIRRIPKVAGTLDGAGEWNPGKWPAAIQKPAVAQVLITLVIVAFAAFFGAKLLPSFSKEVSQKHILGIYFKAEGTDQIGNDIFKYQKGESGTGEDRNFYTAPIPAVASQNELTQVLLADKDELVKVVRSSTDPGEPYVVLRGFDPANDADGDGHRDFEAAAGLATDVEGKTVTDSTQTWTPGQWKDAVFVDWRGTAVKVEDNTKDTVTLAFPPGMDPARTETLRYVLDSPDAPNHQASAMEKERYYVILSQDSFSSVNHSFRTKSGGRHVPVLDSSNANFLLAASYLEEGEENHNRFAQATLTPEEFSKLKDVKGGWVDFDSKLKFLGYTINSDTVGRNDKVKIRFYFEVTGNITANWKVFVHMDSATSSNRIHGDHWPLNMTEDPEIKECVGCWRTNHWMKGDIVVDELVREVPLGSPTGQYNIHFGFYTPGSDKRLEVKDWEKGKVQYRPSDKDRVQVGSFEVN